MLAPSLGAYRDIYVSSFYVKSKEIEMIHRLFLVIAMHCQASSTAVQ